MPSRRRCEAGRMSDHHRRSLSGQKQSFAKCNLTPVSMDPSFLTPVSKGAGFIQPALRSVEALHVIPYTSFNAGHWR